MMINLFNALLTLYCIAHSRIRNSASWDAYPRIAYRQCLDLAASFDATLRSSARSMRSSCSLSEGSLRFQGHSAAGRGNAAYVGSFRRDGTDFAHEV